MVKFAKKANMRIKQIVTLMVCGLLWQAPLRAQTDTTAADKRLTRESVWLGMGHHHTYDNYLSSVLYQGTALGLGFDQQRYYSATFPKLSKYDGAEFHAAFDDNPAQNSRLLSLYFRGFYGAHYHVNVGTKLKIMPGAYTNVDLGIKYLPHNGNNPANVIANSNLWLSLMLNYRFNIGRQPVWLTEHLSAPFIGVMFSPEYTQLYYDMAYVEGDYDVNVVGTNLSNRKQLKNEFDVDLPLGRIATIRLGMVAERLKYEVNNLKGRNLDVSFRLGITHQFYTFKGKEDIPSNFISPLE